MRFIAMTVCCVDIYEVLNTECVGGNSLNIATQYINSNVKHVSVLGAVGKDTYGALVKKHLENNQIDTSHLYALKGRTATNRIYIDEKGDRYFLPNSWDGGVYESFRLSQEDWDFVNTHDVIAICAHDPNFIELTKKKSTSIKLVADFLDRRDFENMQELIPYTDISFISGDDTVVENLKHLTKEFNILIVVTMGAHGSKAVFNGNVYFKEPVPVEDVVDTTGCGDAFQAAFCVSWFKNQNIMEALEAGSLAASFILTHFGGA